MEALSLDLLSGSVSFIITILILSYLLPGDNPLFRAATYVFVGVAAGYVAAVAILEVIVPLLVQPIWSGEAFTGDLPDKLLVFPLLGSALLITKVSARLSRLGQLSVAYLVGVGAAVTIGGALQGTLMPQISATIDGFYVGQVNNFGEMTRILLSSGIILLGVVSTLAYFHFGARQQAGGSTKRNLFINILSLIGRFFIATTFGVLFAGVYMAALTALIERVDAILDFIQIVIQTVMPSF